MPVSFHLEPHNHLPPKQQRHGPPYTARWPRDRVHRIWLPVQSPIRHVGLYVPAPRTGRRRTSRNSRTSRARRRPSNSSSSSSHHPPKRSRPLGRHPPKHRYPRHPHAALHPLRRLLRLRGTAEGARQDTASTARVRACPPGQGGRAREVGYGPSSQRRGRH
jgi:hypothetical protein